MATTSSKRKIDFGATSTKDFETFAQVGGLGDHIRLLKELVIFPLLYSQVYNKFKVKPPRGVLFHGPPGTGKTLLAGALAKECNKGVFGKVNFFLCKGPEFLTKWFGESEQKLRNLFVKASHRKPSIIFFDEIDGLAPIRSDKHEQSHTSIVSTLLTLMDGLDKLPGVVVIGSTNRIDAIDPALRRPGRFDRELYFPLPTAKARREILEVHVNSWTHKPKLSFLNYLAEATVGYCGSDLQALCSEAVMSCLRRNYPGIHGTSKINIRTRDLQVEESDFLMAKSVLMPSAMREVSHMRRLSNIIQPLLQRQLNDVLSLIKSKWPHFSQPDYKYNMGNMRYAGRLLLMGGPNQGQNTHLAPALLHAFEHLPSYVIDVRALYGSAYHTSEEICVQKLTQAKRNLPALILAYRLDEWWNIVQESTRAVLISMLEDIHACLPLLIIATASTKLPDCLTNYFTKHSSIVVTVQNPSETERKQFLYPLFMENAYKKCLKYSNSSEKRSLHGKYLHLNGDTAQNRQHLRPVESRPSMRKFLGNSQSLYKRDKYATRSSTHMKHASSTQRMKTDESARSTSSKIYKLNKSKDNYVHKRRSVETKSSAFLKPAKVNSGSWFPISRALNLARKIQKSLTSMGSLVNDKKVQTHYVNTNFPKDEQPSNEETNIQESRAKLQNGDDEDKMNEMGKEAEGDNVKRKSSLFRNNYIHGETSVAMPDKLKCLYRHAVLVTTKDMSVAHLELFYDMLASCINQKKQDVPSMLVHIANILVEFEDKASATAMESKNVNL